MLTKEGNFFDTKIKQPKLKECFEKRNWCPGFESLAQHLYFLRLGIVVKFKNPRIERKWRKTRKAGFDKSKLSYLLLFKMAILILLVAFIWKSFRTALEPISQKTIRYRHSNLQPQVLTIMRLLPQLLDTKGPFTLDAYGCRSCKVYCCELFKNRNFLSLRWHSPLRNPKPSVGIRTDL